MVGANFISHMTIIYYWTLKSYVYDKLSEADVIKIDPLE